ncbi:MAG: TlpA family protein disulfide reductase [Rikenellaceae bacterium]|nr:TlpA family protein disulfide reductase [Rikenellaceae bacterium]
MKCRLLHRLTLALVAITLGACIESLDPSYEQTTRVRVGDLAPAFVVETLDDQTISLDDLRGKIVLLTFFSSACPDCHAQFEYIKSRITAFDSSKFRFLPIARNEKRATVEQFRLENGYTFDMGFDPEGDIYALYATRYVPRNYLIDSDGRVISISAEPTELQLNELLEKIFQLTR